MKAYLAADYEIGAPADSMTEIPQARCAVCGLELDPVCGKVLEGTMLRYDVWIRDNYEHRSEPEFAHIPVPEFLSED